MRQRLPIFIATSAALLLIWLSEDDQTSDRSAKAAKPQQSQAIAPPPVTLSPRSSDLGPASVVRNARGREAVTIEEIQRALSTADPTVRNHAIDHLFPALAARDPTAAVLIADSITDTELRAVLLRAIANRWAGRDPQQAVAWSQILSHAVERDIVLTEIFSQMSISDPAEAVRLRQWYVNDPTVDPELENLAQRWAEKSFSAALQWSDSLAPGEQRDLVVGRAAFVQAQRSPVEAIQLVMDRMTEGPARIEMLISVLHQWAQRDYAAASAWADQVPPSALRERAALELAAVSNARERE